MKLLLDQNLSRRLVPRLDAFHPGTAHVAELGLERASDSEVWYYARTHGFVVVTKDSDMVELSLLRGAKDRLAAARERQHDGR